MQVWVYQPMAPAARAPAGWAGQQGGVDHLTRHGRTMERETPGDPRDRGGDGHSLAAQGATIAAGYSGNAAKAEQFVAEFTAVFGANSGVTVHQGNVASPEDCRRVIREVLDQHGRLDILVNNAGITIDRTVLKLTDDDWHNVLDVNLSGAFFPSQAALAHMIERGTGRIINLSSIIGEVGNIG